MLRRQLIDRGYFGQKEMLAGAGGLLRVPAPQERGSISKTTLQTGSATHWTCS